MLSSTPVKSVQHCLIASSYITAFKVQLEQLSVNVHIANSYVTSNKPMQCITFGSRSQVMLCMMITDDKKKNKVCIIVSSYTK